MTPMPSPTLRATLAALGLAAALAPSPARSAEAARPAPVVATATPSPAARVPDPCAGAAHADSASLEACIRGDALWAHLQAFQAIADANPDAQGHGNRDTGTPGYKASVDYVAGLMQAAGYRVTVQPYTLTIGATVGRPVLSFDGQAAAWQRDWFAARGSAAGHVDARLGRVKGTGTGCDAAEFGAFRRGQVALLAPGDCARDTQVAHAQAAGAAAILLDAGLPEGSPVPAAATQRHGTPADGRAREVRLSQPARVPVVGTLSAGLAATLRAAQSRGAAPRVVLDLRQVRRTLQDWNVIADSPYGDPSHVVVVDAHLDSIYGPGILDNASGSATILEIALRLARTPTRNQLRYIWFGGEELGLWGSRWYTQHLSPAELAAIAFDVDADVTATPNFDYLVADPANANNVEQFPPDVVPRSRIGTRLYEAWFARAGLPVRKAGFGSTGTDSNSFGLAGVPNTGILTQQDCCKKDWEVALWGGQVGNYEGHLGTKDGGCVDTPKRWCDDLANNDPAVLLTASRATAFVVFALAHHRFDAGAPGTSGTADAAPPR